MVMDFENVIISIASKKKYVIISIYIYLDVFFPQFVVNFNHVLGIVPAKTRLHKHSL